MLRQVPLFSGVAPAKLKLLAFTSDRVTYAPGQMLFRQGDVGDAAYVVLSGKAEVMVDSRLGRSRSPSCRSELDRRRDRHPVQRVAHGDGAGHHCSRGAAHPQGSLPAAARRVSGDDGRNHARAGRPAQPHDGRAHRRAQQAQGDAVVAERNGVCVPRLAAVRISRRAPRCGNLLPSPKRKGLFTMPRKLDVVA